MVVLGGMAVSYARGTPVGFVGVQSLQARLLGDLSRESRQLLGSRQTGRRFSSWHPRCAVQIRQLWGANEPGLVKTETGCWAI